MVCSPQEPLTHSRLVNKRIHIIVVGRGEEGDIIGGDGVKRSNTKIGPSITDSIAKKQKTKQNNNNTEKKKKTTKKTRKQTENNTNNTNNKSETGLSAGVVKDQNMQKG